MQMELAHIVGALGGELHGDPGAFITALAPLESAGAGTLSFLSHAKYRPAGTQCSSLRHCGAPRRVACHAAWGLHRYTNPYLYFARVTQLWRQGMPRPDGPLVHPTAVIAPSAQVHPTAAVGALCVVEAGAQIGRTVFSSPA